ncbi:putative sodium-coupled neutral amino acid transporter 10 [Diabrotica virgifera virgifera]|uniref:Amino acid transporter transmembrane domain-containing protein n=1 Tax=Diabrotica virgifera virgifera TaxID=50390 RepID=A0ABM5JML8_DIAVI|nr:putative sodium-coupled neutral amino acid transporter 10 [Diabrotica virgifera virgifera]
MCENIKFNMEILSGHVMNLANSIIGVSVLAMPYCFKQCGIILSILLLMISSVVSRLACHYLLKSAIISRRKTFEFLAFHLFGSIGKLAIEIGMIGFLLGTCIAFFVVMGDLGPLIIAEVTKVNVTSTMRTSILTSLAVFVVLPLGLLRNVHSLISVSKATMMFYCCLVLRIIIEAIPALFEDSWYDKVNFWRPEGLLQCLPIFSMALFCQTQLFEIYDVVPNPTLDKMNILIQHAVNFCTAVYMCVGIFGYIAFVNKPFTGNILLSFEPGFISHLMKVGFIFSVAFSFPLVIFPCRASLYSCLYKEGYSVHEGSINYIPEGKFKGITILIVGVSLVMGILIPNIELVLGLVGSTIGVMICVLFPVICFICITQKNTNEKIIAQFLLMIGVFVMVVGTYKNLQTVDNLEPIIITVKPIEFDPVKIEDNVNKLPFTVKSEIKPELVTVENNVKEIRHEPPQPIEPIEEEPKKDEKPRSVEEMDKPLKQLETINPADKIEIVAPKASVVNDTKNDQVDIEAIKKEDKEELLEKSNTLKEKDHVDDHKVLIESIKKQNEVQKEIVEQQKELLAVIKKQQKVEEEKKMNEVKQEKMKAVKEIESIALKAIEKISEGEDAKKVVDDVKKGIERSELKEKKIEESLKKDKQEVEDILNRVNDQKDKNKSKELDNKAKVNKEFEKNVENVKQEVQEISSQLNEINKNLKNQQQQPIASNILPPNSPNNEIPLQNLPNTGDRNTEERRDQPQSKDIIPKLIPDSESKIELSKNGSMYLKSGQKDIKIIEETNPSKRLPLPIVSQLNKNINNPLPNIESKEEKNKVLEEDGNNEAQAMRRDILSVSSN